MKNISLFLAFILIFNSAKAQDATDASFTIQTIVNDWNQHQLSFDGVEQMVVVYRENFQDMKLAGVERNNNKWQVQLNAVRASIGRNGLIDAARKVEGDGCTPTGIYALGQLFSYEANIATRIPFIQTNADDKWVDDVNSPQYNKYVRGATSAKSFENLLLKSVHYKYCMVIEYNTQPVVKGKGSAIFFHVADEKYSATAGCVAIAEKDMLQYLKWLDPKKKTAIFVFADEEEED